MLSEQDKELEKHILALLKSGIGFEVFTGGIYYVRNLDNGEIAVGYEPTPGKGWERVHEKEEDAVRDFLETRHKIKIGQDYWEFEE